VKDVNRVSSRRQVEHPVGPSDVKPDLTNAGSNRLHGFPIVWFKSLLKAPKLEARQPSYEDGKRSDVTPRAAEPDERFVRHSSRLTVYKFLYDASRSRLHNLDNDKINASLTLTNFVIRRNLAGPI
jgi:hypothetical protein